MLKELQPAQIFLDKEHFNLFFEQIKTSDPAMKSEVYWVTGVSQFGRELRQAVDCHEIEKFEAEKFRQKIEDFMEQEGNLEDYRKAKRFGVKEWWVREEFYGAAIDSLAA